MEARAKKIGVGGQLKYLFPSGWNAVPQGVNASDAPKAAELGLGDRLLCDLHTLDGCVWSLHAAVSDQLPSLAGTLCRQRGRCKWTSPRSAATGVICNGKRSFPAFGSGTTLKQGACCAVKEPF